MNSFSYFAVYFISLKLTVCIHLFMAYLINNICICSGTRDLQYVAWNRKEGMTWLLMEVFCNTDLTEYPHFGRDVLCIHSFLLIKLHNCRVWPPLWVYNLSDNGSLFVWYNQFFMTQEADICWFFISVSCLFMVNCSF
jgi:hypothetical protein